LITGLAGILAVCTAELSGAEQHMLIVITVITSNRVHKWFELCIFIATPLLSGVLIRLSTAYIF
jgi:hypothetical protein